MSKRSWELILDPALDGETNMAVDSDLLSEVEQSHSPLTVLRFYAWSKPTLSLGRNQKLSRAVDVGFCRANGLDVVHRPTGGRAVLHADELTYAIVSNHLSEFGGGSVYANYRSISEALQLGYQRLGVDSILSPVTLRRDRGTGAQNREFDDPCFVSASRYELMVDGRKIVGSAQRRLRRGFLQHGSMPITCDRDLLARATGFRDPAVLEDEMSGIAECIETAPGIDEMTAVFVGAFEEHFQANFRQRTEISVPSGGLR